MYDAWYRSWGWSAPVVGRAGAGAGPAVTCGDAGAAVGGTGAAVGGAGETGAAVRGALEGAAGAGGTGSAGGAAAATPEPGRAADARTWRPSASTRAVRSSRRLVR